MFSITLIWDKYGKEKCAVGVLCKVIPATSASAAKVVLGGKTNMRARKALRKVSTTDLILVTVSLARMRLTRLCSRKLGVYSLTYEYFSSLLVESVYDCHDRMKMSCST